MTPILHMFWFVCFAVSSLAFFAEERDVGFRPKLVAYCVLIASAIFNPWSLS